MNAARIDPAALAAQRRRRIHVLRMRVAASAVAVFLAIWGLLFVQLANGHDPAIGNAATSAIVQSVDPEVTTDAPDDGRDDGASFDAGTITTSQS